MNELDQLYDELRRERSAAKRQELVYAALQSGVSPSTIQDMLDDLEQRESVQRSAPSLRLFHRRHTFRRILSKLFSRNPG